MTKQRLIPLLFLAAGLLALTAAASLAQDAKAEGPAESPDSVRSADVQVVLSPSPKPDAEQVIRQARIFQVLQGGDLLGDRQLSDHLWQVAASLAQADWTPPRVTVQTVVRELEEQD